MINLLRLLGNQESVKYSFNTEAINFKKSFKRLFKPEEEGRIGTLQAKLTEYNKFEAVYKSENSNYVFKEDGKRVKPAAYASGKIKEKQGKTIVKVVYAPNDSESKVPFLIICILAFTIFGIFFESDQYYERNDTFILPFLAFGLFAAISYIPGFKRRKKFRVSFEKCLEAIREDIEKK